MDYTTFAFMVHKVRGLAEILVITSPKLLRFCLLVPLLQFTVVIPSPQEHNVVKQIVSGRLGDSVG